jgi:hypothetical protein
MISPARQPWNLLWFLGWAIASSVYCVTAAAQIGATFDEPIYLERGLEHWRTGSAAGLLHLGTMPLPADLATAPLYFWERWHDTQIDPARDQVRILPWARATTLIFWWLLLFYGWRCGDLLAGPWGARLSVALLACEPSLLAHASLATTDIAVTSCVLALVYHFRVSREAHWFQRVGIPSICFGLAVLTKASGLVYGVLCLTVIELERLLRQGWNASDAPSPFARLASAWVATQSFRRDLAQIVFGGLLVTFIYCGSDWKPEPSFVAWASHLPPGPGKEFASWLAAHFCIFSNAGEGILRQVKHNLHGHGAYLLGHSAPHGLWYYFPVLLTLKLSVPLLLAPIVVLLSQPRKLVNWACLTAAALIVVSVTWKVQIGIRLVLPIVALGIVGLSAALLETCETLGTRWQIRLLIGLTAAGICWTVVASVRVWPDSLCFVNEFWGGADGGYRYVSDGNYDWGQGLPELARWKQQQGIAELNIWYFGTDPLLRQLPIHELALHALPDSKTDNIEALVAGRYLAVSTTLLYGNISDSDNQQEAANFLRQFRPVARTRTFLIYDFRDALPKRG